ncbi:MAG TPA: DNA-binding transcriptional regulator [Candidatus Sulfotelmatobacter sp.]|nr:DNA-binding transcriptional regulator [Candidatus Sulfotelmatobacter sp.]
MKRLVCPQSQAKIWTMRKKFPRVLLALGWYEQRVHQGIAGYALKAGWHLCADVTKEKVIPWGWEGDGILAWLGAGADLTKFVLETKLPTVDFSYRHSELQFPRVLCDHRAAARLVAEHYLVRGFEHFMYYSAQDNWAFEENGQAFVNVLRDRGHDCDWIRWHQSPAFTTGHSRWKDKRNWLAAQLKGASKPLALFAATDDHALEVVEVCETSGLAVPEEVSVIGVDNALPAVDAMQTPISSVDQNFALLGYRGAELLDQLMHGKAPPAEPIRIPPTGLVSRKSSDLLAINHPGIARSLRYLWENRHRPIGIDDLARVAAMSRSGLHKAFLDHIGRAPGNELHRVRIETAKKLLLQSKKKLEEIAEMSGYQSVNSFWVAFRKATGLSPKQYQKQFFV